MKGNGQDVLRWTARVLSADDLRRNVNGQRELLLASGTLITPLAADELRARGIRVSRDDKTPSTRAQTGGTWGYAEEKPQPLVASVVQALEREGLPLSSLPGSGKDAGAWARGVAECIARGECAGGVLFCFDPGLVCCVANKVKGVRAAAVANVLQAGRAIATLGANLLAVEMPGRTFFELRQIVRCLVKTATCPQELACVLEELDAHR